MKMDMFRGMDADMRAIISDKSGNHKSVIALSDLVQDYPDCNVRQIRVASSSSYVFLEIDSETASLIAERMVSDMESAHAAT